MFSQRQPPSSESCVDSETGPCPSGTAAPGCARLAQQRAAAARSAHRCGGRFAALAAAAALVLPAAGWAAEARSPSPRPNLLYIMTDQQHAGMMSCAGNKHLKTPAMDSLAAAGTRFERAYATNPVCIPSRVSMFTGQMPSRYGVRSNAEGRNQIPEAARKQAMGWIFRNAGYETAFGGKTHWIRGMNPESLGFDHLTPDERDELADQCVRFLQAKRPRPFLLVASFINPHDICYMAIDDFTRAAGKPVMYPQSRREREALAAALRLPENVLREEFFRSLCPPLPDNFEIPALEPECVATDYVKGFRQYARTEWSAERWRLHRWAYCRLTESVDAQIGRVLDALRRAGLEERTVVVFSSDHGDLDAAHRLEHKSVLYEEAARVPFIVSFGSFVDESTALADIVLPDHSYLERFDTRVPAGGTNLAVLSTAQPVVVPLYDTRATPDVLLAIAREMGGSVAQALPWGSFADLLHEAAAALQATAAGSVRAGSAEEQWERMLPPPRGPPCASSSRASRATLPPFPCFSTSTSRQRSAMAAWPTSPGSRRCRTR